MKNMFNVYDNLRTPKIEKTTNISDWFNQIKEKNQYSQLIELARQFGKGHSTYDGIKGSIPAITYNFTFHTTKSNSNIVEGTGLLYIDIDDPSYDITTLDKAKVFAYYKSFGGIGYAVIVKVCNLTFKNYEATYQFVCNQLGLKNFQDKGAKKQTQSNVLSYDPNIFINYESCSFKAIDVDKINEKDPNPYVIKKEEEAYTMGMGSLSNELLYEKVRYSDLYDRVKIIGLYEFNPDGWEYVTCWIPMKKMKLNRNNALLSYCNNLVWLNPHLTKCGTENIMNNVNVLMCQPPVEKAQIKRVVNSIFNQKKESKLIPIYFNRKRKVVFAKNSKLTKEEKLNISGKVINDFKRSVSRNKIYITLEQWSFSANGKITIKGVAKHAGMSKNTVDKYWPEFKDYAKSLNDEHDKCDTKGELRTAIIKPIVNLELAYLKPVEAIETHKAIEFAEVKLDSSESFLVANHKQYERALTLLSPTPKVFFRISMKQFIDGGFEGAKTFKLGDYDYAFNIYGSKGLIEFLSISLEGNILLKVA